jgi:hypothetical protein
MSTKYNATTIEECFFITITTVSWIRPISGQDMFHNDGYLGNGLTLNRKNAIQRNVL